MTVTVCLVCDIFPTKVDVQRMEEMKIIRLKVRRVRWMSQCFPANLSYGVPGHQRHMMSEIFIKVQCTLAINEYWLFMDQHLLHTFQIKRKHVGSDGLAIC